MTEQALETRVQAVRRFNRFYTQRVGALREGLLGSPFSLTQARLLFELAQRPGLTAAELCRELGLDAGYVSRVLRDFEQQGLLRRAPSPADGRESLLALTEQGRAAFAPLDAASRQEVRELLARLPEPEQQRLVQAMAGIQSLLAGEGAAPAPVVLREHRPGDLGWIVGRHGALYAREFGWDATFEALVAEIAARFLREFDPRRERCWIAERNQAPLGSVMLVRQEEGMAQLRLLIVEPEARGLGLGKLLVRECLRFAREAGYRGVRLWTQSILTAARGIYRAEGFRMIREEPHRSFGRDLVAETWELTW